MWRAAIGMRAICCGLTVPGVHQRVAYLSTNREVRERRALLDRKASEFVDRCVPRWDS